MGSREGVKTSGDVSLDEGPGYSAPVRVLIRRIRIFHAQASEREIYINGVFFLKHIFDGGEAISNSSAHKVC